MKYIISETQYKKLISENTRVVQLERYIDLLTKIVKNYDKIDCNDRYMLYSNNYAELYCEQLQDRSLDEISTVRQKMIDEVNDLVNREFMSKYGSLTESELIRFVKRVIQENEEETDKKLLSNFFTIKNNFEYVSTKSNLDVYVLKNKGFDVMVGVKPSEQPNSVVLLIFVIFPSGKRINYLEDVTGRMGSIIPINDYGNMIQLLQGAIDFGRAQSKYGSLSEGYEVIKVRDIPNSIVPFSDKEFNEIENLVSSLSSHYPIIVKREDEGVQRYPRIVIMSNDDFVSNVMYLYKESNKKYYAHTRQYFGGRSEQSLNSYSFKNLNDLSSLFLASENRGLLNLKS